MRQAPAPLQRCVCHCTALKRPVRVELSDLTSPGLAALDANDFGKAGEMQVALTSEDWEENSTWIIAIKRLMDTAKGVAR